MPGDRLIKLHVATWHAGPHFVHDECLFVNLENLDTNRRDFQAVPLEQPRHRKDVADTHLVGLAAMRDKAAENAERLQAAPGGFVRCRS